MKKSPLSTPCSSRAKHGYGWKSHENASRTGYGYVKSENYQCFTPNGSEANHRDDFIPLNVSTPVIEHSRQSGNWYNSGGGGRNYRNSGGGFNHYRNNYQTTPKSHFNNSFSPYKNSGNKQFHTQKKVYQKPTRRQVHISRYVDVKSFLEDPWAELTKKLNDSKEVNGKDQHNLDSLSGSNSNPLDTNGNSEISGVSLDTNCNSDFSQDYKNDSITDPSFGTDNANFSETSNAESSVELKLDNIRFSHESKKDSVCSAYGNICENVTEGGKSNSNDTVTNVHEKPI